jgi:hypothetical protein
MLRKRKQKTNQNTRVYGEIEGTWKMKCMIIPVIIEATGIVTKVERKIWKPNQENIQWILYKNCYTWNITHNRESTAV